MLAAASRGVLNPSFPHSLDQEGNLRPAGSVEDHVRASTDAISLHSSIKAIYENGKWRESSRHLPFIRPLDLFLLYNYTISMNLKSVLTVDTINLHLKGSTKKEIINELLDILITAGKIQNREAAFEAVMDREQKMSTGMKHGIAIPHGKSAAINDLVACIGISDIPVDFDSLDHEPSRIFIMTLSPVEKTGPHLQFLAEISLLFKSAEKRQDILNAQTPETIIKILSE